MKTEKEIGEFEKHERLLRVFCKEISELSVKKPNDAVNRFKLQYINSTLRALNEILRESKPFAEFQDFEPDELPTNSDVTLILAQYAVAVLAFREANTETDSHGSWLWKLNNKRSTLKTEAPYKFRPAG